MGQAAVDLPDPLETPPTSRVGVPDGAPGTASADELLAQMAGQEIDRLLADADVEPEHAPAPLTPATVARDLETNTPDVSGTSIPPPNGTDNAAAAEPPRAADPNADLLPDVPGLDPSTPAPAPPRAHIPVGPNTSATEDAAVAELFDQLTGGIGGGLDPAGAAAPPDSLGSAPDLTADGATVASNESGAPDATLEAASTAASPDEHPSAASNSDVLEMTPAERAALEAPLPATDDPLDAPPAIGDLPPEPAALDHAEAPALEAEDPAPIFQYERVSFVVRMLEWINGPFDALPDGARDAIGKIAVMTLVNAVAILIYVLFFRH